MDDPLKKVYEAYDELQLLQRPEREATLEEMRTLAENWKDSATPALQRKVVDVQLENFRNGIADPVFTSLMQLLQKIPEQSLTFLDAACASGYYSEVIKNMDPRPIHYHGCDYSESMVEEARSHYPENKFEVQDLTALKYADRSFDVVMASGVLEHVPAWTQGIQEICRVAAKYVIQHRCPLSGTREHEYTIGTQYNIETPRIFFSRELLLKEYELRRYRLIAEVDIYPPEEPSRSVRSLLQTIFGAKKQPVRTNESFLFQRQA